VLFRSPRPEKAPVVEGAPGHGCGHNLLGTGACLAAIGVKQWLAAAGLWVQPPVPGSPGGMRRNQAAPGREDTGPLGGLPSLPGLI
jgi:hypothetical protein